MKANSVIVMLFITAGTGLAADPNTDHRLETRADEREVAVPYRIAVLDDGSPIRRGIVVDVAYERHSPDGVRTHELHVYWAELTVVEVSATRGTITLRAASKRQASEIRQRWEERNMSLIRPTEWSPATREAAELIPPRVKP